VPPGFWQLSRYAPRPGQEFKDEKLLQQAKSREALVIRGPGAVGSPGCNVVCRFAEGADPAIIKLFVRLFNVVWHTQEVQVAYREQTEKLEKEFKGSLRFQLPKRYGKRLSIQGKDDVIY
jgi:hypothetical protein